MVSSKVMPESDIQEQIKGAKIAKAPSLSAEGALAKAKIGAAALGQSGLREREAAESLGIQKTIEATKSARLGALERLVQRETAQEESEARAEQFRQARVVRAAGATAEAQVVAELSTREVQQRLAQARQIQNQAIAQRMAQQRAAASAPTPTQIAMKSAVKSAVSFLLPFLGSAIGAFGVYEIIK